MPLEVFVVKHKPSGKYLPPVRAYHSVTTRPLSDTPRVFYRRQDAIRAAKWWAAGRASTEYVQGTYGREPIGVVSELVEGRLLSDLFICNAEIQQTKPYEAIK